MLHVSGIPAPQFYVLLGICTLLVQSSRHLHAPSFSLGLPQAACWLACLASTPSLLHVASHVRPHRVCVLILHVQDGQIHAGRRV